MPANYGPGPPRRPDRIHNFTLPTDPIEALNYMRQLAGLEPWIPQIACPRTE